MNPSEVRAYFGIPEREVYPKQVIVDMLLKAIRDAINLAPIELRVAGRLTIHLNAVDHEQLCEYEWWRYMQGSTSMNNSY